MASLAVVTSSPPATDGGHLVIARALVKAAEDAGHQATLVVTPDYGFGRTFSTYWANRRTSVGRVDQVISLRYPSYAVKHPAHVCWLNHTMREYYDLWPRFSAGLSVKNRIKESLRRATLRATDSYLLKRNVRRVFAQSYTIQQRLTDDFHFVAPVVYPPAPQRPYRCEGYEPYIFCVSRLVSLKRVDLLIRALADPRARHVTAVIAGDGDARRDLEALAASTGVATRVTFLGHIDENTMLSHLARCRAVCFTPIDEDYGLVTMEAFASRKAVVTCRDSGGPTELVRHGDSGFITEPTPSELAAALAHLSEDWALAERLGANGHAQASALSWDATLKLLMVV